eukprot:2828961-Rhodomonas_salina.1
MEGTMARHPCCARRSWHAWAPSQASCTGNLCSQVRFQLLSPDVSYLLRQHSKCVCSCPCHRW